MTERNVNRYGEVELMEFKIHVEKKVAKTEKQLASLKEQLADAADAKDNEGDWMDDSSTTTDIEVLEMMTNRQRKHLMDLQNALQRIHNKSYGICSISGKLIDKRRLLAVPTTTKSLTAKIGNGDSASKRISRPSVTSPLKAKKTPKIISRIIRRPVSNETAQPKVWEEEDVEMDLELADRIDLIDLELDSDNYSEEEVNN